MQYTRLGNSGLIVSRLAFGVTTFGHDQGQMAAVWKTSQEDANALVQRSLDAASWMSSPLRPRSTRTGSSSLRPTPPCAMCSNQTENPEEIHG